MEWDFDVEKRNISFEREEDYGRTIGIVKIPDKKVIVRKDTETPLSVVSDRYEVTQHREVFDLFNSIDELHYKSYNLSYDGSVCFWSFDLPNSGRNKHEIKVGETVRFSFRAFNSHNLTTSRGGELIAHNLVCSNGMVMPKKVGKISFRHRNNEFYTQVGNRIHEFQGDITNMVDMWKKWLNIRPENSRIDAFVNKLDLGSEEIETSIKDRMKEKDNLWEVYNVLTYYTTHKMINRGKNRLINQRKKDYEYTNAFYKYSW